MTPTPLTESDPPMTYASYDAREEKLPRWARDLIAELRRDAEHARTTLDEVKGQAPAFPVAVRDPYGEAVAVAWGPYDEIRFAQTGALHDGYGPDGHWVGVRRRTEGEIEVCGSSALTVCPQSSNVIRVSVTNQ